MIASLDQPIRACGSAGLAVPVARKLSEASTWLAKRIGLCERTYSESRRLELESVDSDENVIATQPLQLHQIWLPVAEELVFRGIFQGALMGAFSLPLRVLASASVFTAAHYWVFDNTSDRNEQMAQCFGSGLTFAAAFELGNQSVLASSIAHLVFNLG